MFPWRADVVKSRWNQCERSRREDVTGTKWSTQVKMSTLSTLPTGFIYFFEKPAFYSTPTSLPLCLIAA